MAGREPDAEQALEDNPIFDLKQSIQEWRRSLLSRGQMSDEQVDELQDHLEEELKSLSESGLSEKENLSIALGRLGHGEPLLAEFKKVHWTPSPLLWMCLGHGVFTAGVTCAHAIFLLCLGAANERILNVSFILGTSLVLFTFLIGFTMLRATGKLIRVAEAPQEVDDAFSQVGPSTGSPASLSSSRRAALAVIYGVILMCAASLLAQAFARAASSRYSMDTNAFLRGFLEILQTMLLFFAAPAAVMLFFLWRAKRASYSKG